MKIKNLYTEKQLEKIKSTIESHESKSFSIDFSISDFEKYMQSDDINALIHYLLFKSNSKSLISNLKKEWQADSNFRNFCIANDSYYNVNMLMKILDNKVFQYKHFRFSQTFKSNCYLNYWGFRIYKIINNNLLEYAIVERYNVETEKAYINIISKNKYNEIMNDQKLDDYSIYRNANQITYLDNLIDDNDDDDDE
jgi:hypothetical protein